jgi:hypothetical protein
MVSVRPSPPKDWIESCRGLGLALRRRVEQRGVLDHTMVGAREGVQVELRCEGHEGRLRSSVLALYKRPLRIGFSAKRVPASQGRARGDAQLMQAGLEGDWTLVCVEPLLARRLLSSAARALNAPGHRECAVSIDDRGVTVLHDGVPAIADLERLIDAAVGAARAIGRASLSLTR